MAVSKWIGRLKEKVEQWRRRWANDGPPPQLFLRKHEDENVIFDSRYGEGVEYAIPDVSARILHSMEIKPKDLIDLGREFAAVPDLMRRRR